MKNMKKLAVLFLLASCAGSIEDIDRTQPNILEKDFFSVSGMPPGRRSTSCTPPASPLSVRARGRAGQVGCHGLWLDRLSVVRPGRGRGSDNPRRRDVRGPMMYFPIWGHLTSSAPTRRRVSRATCSRRTWRTVSGTSATVPRTGSNIRWRAGNGSYYIQENDDDDPEDAIRMTRERSPRGHHQGVLPAELDAEPDRLLRLPDPEVPLYANPY